MNTEVLRTMIVSLMTDGENYSLVLTAPNTVVPGTTDELLKTLPIPITEQLYEQIKEYLKKTISPAGFSSVG